MSNDRAKIKIGWIKEWQEKALDAEIDLRYVDMDKEMDVVFDEFGITKLSEKTNLRRYVFELQQEAANSNKRQRLMTTGRDSIAIPFEATEKKRLEMGDLAQKFGSMLLDRESPKNQLYEGLAQLANQVGKKNLDKKQVPVLGLSAPSGAGKTEFLKWVFNECCTYAPHHQNETGGPNNTATKVLQRINDALPHGQSKFDNVLVLFASFNQMSPYVKDEGPIVLTTVERLLRSFCGDVTMGGNYTWKDQYFTGFANLADIMEHFSSEQMGKGKTAFIFCVDELSKLRGKDALEYEALMDHLLLASQMRLSGGGFCAIVAAALAIHDFGEVVLQLSGRAIMPIQFPAINRAMAKKASEFVHNNTEVFKCAESSKGMEEFNLRVTTSILESQVDLRGWEHIMDMKLTETRINPPTPFCPKPDSFTHDEIFLLVAQGLFAENVWVYLDKLKLHELFNLLSGSVKLKPAPGGVLTRFENQMCQMVVPAWRLLGLKLPNHDSRLFTWVENWVLIETRKLFYTYTPAECQKTWELATMGVLELRRAMLLACSEAEEGDPDMGRLPKLQMIVQDLDVHHNVCDDLLESYASAHAAQSTEVKELTASILAKKVEMPIFFYSQLANEKAVEGVFKGGFDTEDFEETCIFFQMKLYKTATPLQISKWLGNAHRRALELGLKDGTFVIQLFVTGALEANIKDREAAWPTNCMVFGTKSLTKLFEPFGRGIIDEIIRLKSRETPASK